MMDNDQAITPDVDTEFVLALAAADTRDVNDGQKLGYARRIRNALWRRRCSTLADVRELVGRGETLLNVGPYGLDLCRRVLDMPPAYITEAAAVLRDEGWTCIPPDSP